jgi:hypothetical protein
MSLDRPQPRLRRASVSDEEEKAWVDFYRRAGREPDIAAEVLAELDADPEMKRAHLALYLRCRQSLRSHALRQARNQRIGVLVRWLCHGLFVLPVQALHRALSFGGDLAAECVPERARVPAEPAMRRPSRKAGRASSPAPVMPRPQAAAVAATLVAAGAEIPPSRPNRPDAAAPADGSAPAAGPAGGVGNTVLTVVP